MVDVIHEATAEPSLIENGYTSFLEKIVIGRLQSFYQVGSLEMNGRHESLILSMH